MTNRKLAKFPRRWGNYFLRGFVTFGLSTAALTAFAADVTVQVAVGQEAFGKVSGGKANAKEGATLTLKATAAKGYGFCGWFEGSTPVSYRSSWKYAVEGSDKTFTAKFVEAKDDGFDLTDMKPSGYALAIGETPVASACFAVTRRAEATALSETTVKVSGLPNGVKAVAGTDPKKNGSVEFTGAPTKAGVYYVMFEAKNANGYVQALTQKWIVGGASDGDFDETGHAPLGDRWDQAFVGKGFWDCFPNDAHQVKKLAVSGLPSGLKSSSGIWEDGDSLEVDIEGYPTKLGKYVLGMVMTYHDGTVKKGRQTVIVKDAGSYYVTVDVGSGSEGLGTVSGSGVYRVGSKISLSAKPASKDYVFAGWFTDKACKNPLVSDDNVTSIRDYFTASREYRKANDSMTFYYEAINKARNIYAKFIPKNSDSILLRTDLGGKNSWESGDVYTYWWASIGYAVDSGTLPTVTAKGLPPGFKLDTKNLRIEVDYSKVKPGAVYENVQLIAKNLTGLTDVKTFTVYIGNYKSSLVPNLKTATDAYEAMVGEDMQEVEWREDLKTDGSYEDWKVSASGLPPGVKFSYDPKGFWQDFWLTGVPSKAGVYTPIFTFTRGSGAAKRTQKFSFTITVYDQSPALIGTFNGVTCWDDTTYTDIRAQSLPVTITAAKGGKVTAKVGNVSFSGNGWIHNGGDKWLVRVKSGIVKEGDKKRFYVMTINASSELKSLGELDMTGWLSRGEEGDEGALPYDGSNFFAKQNCYGKKYWTDDRAAELAAMKTMYFEEGGWSENWISLTRTTDTKAPFKVTVDKKGVMKLSGKYGSYNLSGSTTLLPETDGSLTGWLPRAIKAKDGCTDYFLIRFIYKDATPSLSLDARFPCG